MCNNDPVICGVYLHIIVRCVVVSHLAITRQPIVSSGIIAPVMMICLLPLSGALRHRCQSAVGGIPARPQHLAVSQPVTAVALLSLADVIWPLLAGAVSGPLFLVAVFPASALFADRAVLPPR